MFHELDNEEYAILTKWVRPANFETTPVQRTKLPAGRTYTPKEYRDYKEQISFLRDMNQ